MTDTNEPDIVLQQAGGGRWQAFHERSLVASFDSLEDATAGAGRLTVLLGDCRRRLAQAKKAFDLIANSGTGLAQAYAKLAAKEIDDE